MNLLPAALPLSLIVGLSLIVLVAEALLKESEKVSYWISVLGLAVCAVVSSAMIPASGLAFGDMITAGGYGSFFSALFAVAALLTVVLSRDYIRRERSAFGEYYLLILFATTGMMLMASAADLIVIFLGLELMSICLYVLAGFFRDQPTANESSFKYFLLGAFATGFLLYGIALIYGACGSTHLSQIRNPGSPYFWIGIGLIMVGFAFKVGAVPFHMWIPDVYQGSPTPVSGFMSTGAKAAAFSAFIIVFGRPFDDPEKVRVALSLLAAASMILGNIIAVSQSNIKRMLAYSSIAHAGYMLAGLAASNALGRSGIMFYLASYTFMNVGAFGILAVLERGGKNLEYSDYAGLSARHPFLAATMAAFMFSLAGIPPFAGFFAKYYVFTAAVEAHLTWLAILGVLTSLVSVYYYLRLVVLMYFTEGEAGAGIEVTGRSSAVFVLSVAALLLLGIFPSALLSVINRF